MTTSIFPAVLAPLPQQLGPSASLHAAEQLCPTLLPHKTQYSIARTLLELAMTTTMMMTRKGQKASQV